MEPYQQLEREWAEFNGLDPAGMVVCSSGTAALHLALEALRLPPGSEVVVPDFTMIACARAVTLAGLVPVFVDCGSNLNLDPGLLDHPSVRTKAIKAVMPVHVYGRRCDMERIARIAELDKGWLIVEDLAEAHGVRPHQATDAACWSFFKNKIVAGEEGGAVWFRDPERAANARQLRCLGFTDAHDFAHVPRGHNYRLSNLHASYILGGTRLMNPNRLDRFHANMEWRREIEGWCDAACPAEWRMPPRDAPWVYDLRLPKGADQDAVVAALRAAGIAARHCFKTMSGQEEYLACRAVWSFDPERGPVHQAEELSWRVIYLPHQPGRTTGADCDRAFEVIQRTLAAP